MTKKPMNIIEQISDLKGHLLKSFESKVRSGESIDQFELEDAIRGHQKCDFNTAKLLIILLGEYYPRELASIYKLVDWSGASIEIKEILKKAHDY